MNRCGDDYLFFSIGEILTVFLKFGYAKKQIIKMTTERPQILCYGTDVIEEKLKYFKKLLGNTKTVIKVTLDFPTMLSYDLASVDKKIEDLEKIGYERDVIIKNIKRYPELLGLSIEDNIKKMIKDLCDLGFDSKDVLKITAKNMTIFGRDIKSIEDIIEKLEDFGYSREDIIDMIKKHPSLLNYAVMRIEERVNDIVSLVPDYNDALNVLKINPSLFGNDLGTIIDKKVFYDSIGLFDIFVISPKDLMQGISKSYARYRHFQTIGIDIFETEDGYKKLFLGEKKFGSRYKIKTDDLVKIYDVDEYMKDVKTRKLA